MIWKISSDRPIYIQLVEQIQAAIISEYYKPGDRLPSVRDLAAEATVNPNTMQKALSELELTGLVYSDRTKGRFITSNQELIKSLKIEEVEKRILEFLVDMKQLGFTEAQVVDLLIKKRNSADRRDN